MEETVIKERGAVEVATIKVFMNAVQECNNEVCIF